MEDLINVTLRRLKLLRWLTDLNEICALLCYGITECCNIKPRRSRLYASRASSGIQELTQMKHTKPLPFFCRAHARRLTWRERTAMACLIPLFPITEFNRNSDLMYLITTLDLSYPNTGRYCLCKFARIWFGYIKLGLT
jgi:hypothetical protein